MKRIIFFCLSLLLVTTAWADGDVIEISTEEQLVALRNAVNDGTDNYSGKTVRLTADLSFDSSWTVIGTTDDEAHSFCGIFDGQGHTITFNSVSANATVLALFGYFRGTVLHLKVAGSVTNINATSTSSTAGIVAYNRGTVSECANTAHVVGTTAGGIAGENIGTICHCYNTGYVGGTSGASTYYLGGIAGVCEENSSTLCVYASCNIENVTNKGGITANQKSGAVLTNYFYNVMLRNGNSESSLDGSTILTGDALKSSLGETYWTFSVGQLPELKCFAEFVMLENNSDNSTVISANHGLTRTVELSERTLYKDNSWNTLCLPFSLTEAQIADSPLDGAVIKELNNASYAPTTNELTLNFSTVTSMEAGKPYLIKWATGDDVKNPRFSDVVIQNIDVAGRTVGKTKVSFVGTFAPVVIGNNGDNLYLGSNNTLHDPQSADYTVRAFRAYFHLEDYGVSFSRSYVLNFDYEGGGETTAIDSRHTAGTQQSAHRLTLTGRRLNGRISKGVVLEHQADGSYKKVVIK